MRSDSITTEYIVVGSGIAGLRAAIDLAESGRVAIFTKSQITESNSMYAQGGIAAAIGQNDDVEKHYSDTVSSGAGRLASRHRLLACRPGRHCRSR